jgi:hypothetical protein
MKRSRFSEKQIIGILKEHDQAICCIFVIRVAGEVAWNRTVARTDMVAYRTSAFGQSMDILRLGAQKHAHDIVGRLTNDLHWTLRFGAKSASGLPHSSSPSLLLDIDLMAP